MYGAFHVNQNSQNQHPLRFLPKPGILDGYWVKPLTASKAGGRWGHVPAIKIAGGTSPPKICMKISNSDYFNGFKLDRFKFHHNFSIVVAILDRTKPIHVHTSAIKNTCHSIDPTRKRPLKCVPPSQKRVATPLVVGFLFCDNNG